MQIDHEQIGISLLALGLMGSKEKWVSGQKGPLTNSLQILCQDRSALLHCACKATIYQEQCAQG